MINRKAIATLALSVSGFVTILAFEGYSEKAVAPLPGDVPTLGFGSTGPDIKSGDRTNPVKAVQRAARDVTKFEGGVKRCVNVPLYQHEYDAYVSLAYNIGPSKFCSSTLVKMLNQQRYDEACAQILRWNRFQGQVNRGLANRREREYQQCMGNPA